MRTLINQEDVTELIFDEGLALIGEENHIIWRQNKQKILDSLNKAKVELDVFTLLTAIRNLTLADY